MEFSTKLIMIQQVPVTNKECASIYFHGNKVSGSNRWFDKSINVLCQANGKLGKEEKAKEYVSALFAKFTHDIVVMIHFIQRFYG